jgi:hypothetical protein
MPVARSLASPARGPAIEEPIRRSNWSKEFGAFGASKGRYGFTATIYRLGRTGLSVGVGPAPPGVRGTLDEDLEDLKCAAFEEDSSCPRPIPLPLCVKTACWEPRTSPRPRCTPPLVRRAY